MWGVSTRFRLQIGMIPQCEQSFGTPHVMENTGKVLNVLDLAREYGFTDLDGTLPDWDY